MGAARNGSGTASLGRAVLPISQYVFIKPLPWPGSCVLFGAVYNAIYYTMFGAVYNTIYDTMFVAVYNAIYDTMFGAVYNTIYDTMFGAVYNI